MKFSLNLTKFLFPFIFVIIFLGVSIQGLDYYLQNWETKFLRQAYQNNQLTHARLYFATGQLDKTIEEYEDVLKDLDDQHRQLLEVELTTITNFLKSPYGQLYSFFGSSIRLWPLRLYLLAFIIILFLLALGIPHKVKGSPLFKINPFEVNSKNELDKKLSHLALHRLQEIAWRVENLTVTSNLAADSLEIPTLGMVNETNNDAVLDLFDTALQFSIGLSGFPLASLFETIRLWLEQPGYIVQGILERNSSQSFIGMLLYDRKTGSMLNSWNIQLAENQTTITDTLDAIIFPLLYYFSKNITTNSWEALWLLHSGLEKFQIYRESNYKFEYLNQAIKNVETALKIDPGYILGKYNLGIIFIAAGEYKKAREYLEDVYKSATDENIRYMAYYNYGIALYHTSKTWSYERAAKVFEELLNE